MSRRARGRSRPPAAVPPPRTGRWRAVALGTIALVGLLAVGRVSWPSIRGLGRSEAPNVLMITIDTLRWDHVGVYGGANANTPNLDALAGRGTRFETAIMHAPLTAPSHASMLTGLTPPHHGVRDNGGFVLPSDIQSLPAVFKRAGYDTAGFISGFPLDRRFGFASHFDTFDDRLPRGDGTASAHTERRADRTTDVVLEWLKSRAAVPASGAEVGKPWLAWVHYFDPHAPYEPPVDVRAPAGSGAYDGEITFVDGEIGRLLRALEDDGVIGRTIVLVTADHGESLGEHAEETHGVFVYDATVRVPWIMAGPGVRKGIVSSVVARGVDLMPTLAALSGLAVPDGIDGRSLLPAVQGRSMPDEPAYIESLMAQRHLGWAPIHGIRDAQWKFIDVPHPELYDVKADPGERRNQAAADTTRTAAMSKAVQAHLDVQRALPGQAPDRETSDRLRALGYLGGPSRVAGQASGRDPKDGIALINRLERAIAAIRTDPPRAASELRAVLTEDPRSQLARRQLAVALAATGDHRGTIDEIKKLESDGNATAEDLLLRAESHRVLGEQDAARRAMDDAARLNPNSPEVALTQARAFMIERRPQDADAAYRRALALSPDNAEGLVGLGNLALAQGDTRGAAASFERVLSRDPSDLSARAGLGLVRGREGRMADAIALLEPVVRESPNHAEALAGLGAALARSGQPASAIPYFQRAIENGLKTTPVLNGLGFARLEAGDSTGAVEALRASLAIQQDQPRVHQILRDLAAQSTKR